MPCKPLIGINADYRPKNGETPSFSYLAAGYADCILKAGGLPVVVPPLEEIEDIECLLDSLKGFVLVGGKDLDPNRDGYMRHPSVRIMDPRRESFDRLLAQRIVKRKMPVYGIGSGMQLLNIIAGGNLMLHIPEDVPSAVAHQDPLDPGHRHGLEVENESLLEMVYGDGETTTTQVVPTRDLPPFGIHTFTIPFDATGQAWVRFAAWDSAGNGAMTMPIRLGER